MSHYLLMCKSLTYAQRTAKTLERYGITAIVTKGPQGLSDKGCVYCVKIPEKRLADAITVMHAAELDPVKVFLQEKGGIISEVAI